MLTVLAALTSLGPVASQTIEGRVVDAASGAPIPMAHVTLIGTSDAVVASEVTDTNGSFLMPVPEAGMYQLRAMRVGYTPFTTDTLVLAPGQEAVAHLRLQPTGVRLSPVQAVAEARVQRLVRVGFYKRLAQGFGYFRSPDELDNLRPIFHADLFWGMRGVRLRRDGRVESQSAPGRCYLTAAIDGVIVERGAVTDPHWTSVVHVNDIEALEVYPRPAGVPLWLSGSVSPCGAVVVWTKGSR